MSNILKIAAAGAAAAAEETDENFNQTVLLLHGDGTNGAQNNTFLDSSTNNFTITRNGNTTQGTFSPFSVGQKEWSTFFNGSSTSLRVPGTTAFQLGTGAFTCEAWITLREYTTSAASAPTSQYIVGTYDGSSGGFAFYFFNDSGTYKLAFRNGDASVVTRTFAFELNKHYHVAVSRDSSSVLRFFVDGTQIGVDETGYTQNITRDNSFGCSVGRFILSQAGNPNGGYFSGTISNARVVKGRAVYTSAFTPPTSPLGATSGGEDPPQGSETSLLMCQYSRFIDDSASPKTVTIQGSPQISPFSPFAPTAAYSTSVNGGSAYLDGTGDYLTVPDDAAFEFGSSNFTLEAWIYQTGGAGGTRSLFAKRTSDAVYGGYDFFIDSSNNLKVLADDNTSSPWAVSFSGGAIASNEWTHVALTRNGSTWTLWKNGVSAATATASITINDQATNVGIGAIANGQQLFTGYIAGARILNGTAIDFSSTGVPTAPPTNITNTSLLLNFTNAAIFDQTGKNNLETVADAQIDTTTKKYGTGSMEFDGTGDVLKLPLSPNLDFGTGDFTIECWAYITDLSPGYNPTLIARWQFGSNLYTMQILAGGTFRFITAAGTWTGGSISVNTWTHLAVSRSGTNLRLFNNGVLESTNTDSTSLTSATQITSIGGQGDALQSTPGFIDDVRITKGVARYTTTFTPPTKAFPDL